MGTTIDFGYASIEFLIWMPIAFVCTIIYILTAIQVHRHRTQTPFNSTFYRIWFSLGCADISIIIYSWTFARLPSIHLLTNVFIDNMPSHARQIFAGDQSVFLHYLFHVEIIGVTLLAINRYTSFCRPLQHKMVCWCFCEYIWVVLLFYKCIISQQLFCSYGHQIECVLHSYVNGVYHYAH